MILVPVVQEIGLVYFVQPVDGGPIKIGTTINIDVRLKQLEQTYGRPLALLATMDGDRDAEQAIHSRFAHLRLGRTEQFRPAADLLAFIGRPLLVGANSEVVEVMPSVGLLPVLSMRGRPEWRDWLLKMGRKLRANPAALIDRALFELAMREGFEEPPPRL